MTDHPQDEERDSLWQRLTPPQGGAVGYRLRGRRLGIAARPRLRQHLSTGPRSCSSSQQPCAADRPPIVLVLAWYHGDKGQQRVTRAELAIITLLFLLGGGMFWRYSTRTGRSTSASRRPAAPPGATDHSIAVLPFLNISPDKEQEYFSDGLSEELLNLLAKIPRLQVTARTSSFSFKGKEIAIPEIARQLHVTHVLEGAVRKAGNKVRITAQLIDASTDTPTCGPRPTIARSTTSSRSRTRSPPTWSGSCRLKIPGVAPRARQTDPEAYALYLQAVQLTRKRSAEGFTQADVLLRRAVAIDPKYAPAWAQLSSNTVNEVTIGARSRDQAFPEARAAATKAIEIDPESARAHASLGSLAIFEDDIPTAARHFERALALDPTDLVVLGNSSAVLKGLGRLNDAIALDEAVVRRDPVNTSWLFNLASAQNWAGRYDEAIGSLRAVQTLNPGYAGSHLVYGEALLGKGDPSGALEEVQREAVEPFKMMGLPMAYHALGRKADSDAALAALIAKYGKDAPYDVAYIYAFRGEADKAFEWLDKAAAAHDTSLILLLVENLFTNIHSDPRWLSFLRKLGKAPEQLAAIKFDVKLPN